VTADASDETRERTEAAGMNMVQIKPLDPSQLADLLTIVAAPRPAPPTQDPSWR
jgi:hypothetical protein